MRAEQRARAATSRSSTRPRSPSSPEGPDALTALQQLCANEIDVPVGRTVYTALLNGRGGFESDLTVARLDETSFFIVTGTAQATRDADWIRRRIADDRAILTDVTSS